MLVVLRRVPFAALPAEHPDRGRPVLGGVSGLAEQVGQRLRICLTGQGDLDFQGRDGRRLPAFELVDFSTTSAPCVECFGDLSLEQAELQRDIGRVEPLRDLVLPSQFLS
jgi:hypothetical protein